MGTASEPERSPSGDKALVAVNLVVTGKVQGTGLRGAVHAGASRIGLRGWVRNLNKDAVHMHLEGPRSAVMSLVAKVQAGLGRAEIRGSTLVHTTPAGYATFEVLRQDSPDVAERDAALLAETIRKTNAAQESANGAYVSEAHSMLRVTDHPKLADSLLHLPVDQLSEPLLRLRFRRTEPLGCSFSAMMWHQTHVRSALKLAGHQPTESMLGAKLRGREFADAVGLQRIRVLQQRVPLADVELREATVVKPEHGFGSGGVYILTSATHQRRVADGREFGSLKQVRADLERYVKAQEQTSRTQQKEDSWIVEELVLGPDGQGANDLKFYCFYGRAAVALEVRRRPDGTSYCWWDRSGKPISTGKYDDKLFEGDPVDDEGFRLAEAVSLKIRAPFMRIDFLRGNGGLRFCEFTPRPGGFHQFARPFDRLLGYEFVQAQARLFEDLCKGKTFPEFELLAGRRPSKVPIQPAA